MISFEQDRCFGRLHVNGEMTVYNATECEDVMMDRLSQCQEMEINLSGLKELDSVGLQMLMMIKSEAERMRKKVRFVNYSPALEEVLALCKPPRKTGYFSSKV